MIIPPALQKGDAVAIVSSARAITNEEVAPAIDLLQSWDMMAVIGNTIGLRQGQFAGTDRERRDDFQRMLDDPGIKAIWCARGGYGTVRIIDDLDFTKFKKNPKWIVGYSDITVLHSQLNILGFESLHAQMAHNIHLKLEPARETLRNALLGIPFSYEIPASEKNRIGIAKGTLVGGNLSMLYSLLGSPSAISTENKILFLEDLDEYLYHVDRMMQNLKRNGLFNNIKGLIVGGMSEMKDNLIPFGKTAGQIIWEIVEEYDFPVIFNFPAGHIEDNRALIMGREVSMQAGLERTFIDYTE